MKNILPELFRENLVRGRGLFCQSMMKVGGEGGSVGGAGGYGGRLASARGAGQAGGGTGRRGVPWGRAMGAGGVGAPWHAPPDPPCLARADARRLPAHA